MESLLLPWTFAPDLKVKLLLLILAGQMGLAIYLYIQLSKARMAAGKAGRITADLYKATENEPADLRVFARAVANQFELPVMFYALVVAGIAASISSWITVILAGSFVALRIVHAREMITTNTVLKRRKTFFRSVQVLLLMLVEFVLSAVFIAAA